LELLRLAGEVRLAGDGDARRRSDDPDVFAPHDAVLDEHVAGDLVEGKALAEDILVVEGQPAPKRLERKDTEQLRPARVELDELACAGFDAELAGKRGVVERLRTTLPCKVAAHLRRRPADSAGQAEAREVLARIAYVEGCVQLGLLFA